MLQARLEDHRRQRAEQVAQQDERDLIRQQIRGQLEARTKWLKASPEATLRALGVKVAMDPMTFRADLARTVRKARLQYHPDRHQVSFIGFSMDGRRTETLMEDICRGVQLCRSLQDAVTMHDLCATACREAHCRLRWRQRRFSKSYPL